MRIINSNDIAEVVKGMCIKANCHINKDIKSALSNSVKTEKSDISKGVIENLLKNAEIADSKEVPICQDTGMAVFFIEIGVIDFVIETVKKAGANPCPPMVIGVGIGGTMDKAAQIAKKALTRDIDVPNSNPFYAELEKTLLEKINKLGIGPQGMGGTTTALAVNVETFPTHIAGLPVAVNVNCHATRHTVEII